MGTITIQLEDWDDLRQKIREEFGDSMILISSKMRRELGFTVRRHQWWDEYEYHEDIRLDFYDDAKETWFRMKYL